MSDERLTTTTTSGGGNSHGVGGNGEQKSNGSGNGPKCTHCGSTEIVSDEKYGVVCAGCSFVLEEDIIVNQTEFTKTPGGQSSVTGQFVGEFCTKPFANWSSSGHGGYMRTATDMTLLQGKKHIQQLASQLNLDSHHIDAAHRLFVLAVQRNFIQGRKTKNVVAACLYIVCRWNRTPRLLIDFSELLQTNIYALGNVFLKFSRLLNVKIPVIDPTHYIERFAARLEFEGKELEVAKTARMLVKRMKKDWIQTGRRPSGICGAALILAARMHGFRRSQKEVVEVMRICEQTLRNRLLEFEATPSGNLTMEEFLAIDLPEEANPPSFTRNRMKEALMLENANAKASSSLKSFPESNHRDPKQQHSLSESQPGPQSDDEDISDSLIEPSKAKSKRFSQLRQREMEKEATYEELSAELRESLRTMEKEVGDIDLLIDSAKTTTTIPTPITSSIAAANENPIIPPVSRNQVRLLQEPETPPRKKVDLYSSDLSDLSDSEMDGILLSESEANRKKAVWTSVHQNYLKEQAEKKRQEAIEGKPKPKRRKRKTRDSGEGHDGDVEGGKSSQKVSKKIDYQKWYQNQKKTGTNK